MLKGEKMSENILTSIVSLLIGFSLNHFSGDDRFSVLNKGKYQLGSTGTIIIVFLMITFAFFASLSFIIAIVNIVTSNDSSEEMHEGALVTFLVAILGVINAYRAIKAYNPYFTFIRYDGVIYKLLSLTDAGYLVKFVDIDDRKVIISEVAKCLPIDAPTGKLSKIIALRKKDFEKIDSEKFLTKFEL